VLVLIKSPSFNPWSGLVYALVYDHEVNHHSASTETGMSRLALSDADKKARDWFVSTTQALGCHTTIDEMGNIFAVRPGIRDDGPPTFVGSHLDTQPTGGRYDGILGVTAGVEMLKVLADNWVETEYPVGVVNWTKCVHSVSTTHHSQPIESPDFQPTPLVPLNPIKPENPF
jgi:hypothetical protein